MNWVPKGLLAVTAILSVGANTEGILTIHPDHHGDWIKGVAAKPIDETLFLIIEHPKFAWMSGRSMYRLEARPMRDLATVMWSINLNELPGVKTAIDHAAEDSQILDWQLVPLDDSLIIVANLLTLFHPKPNLLFRVNKEGNVVANRKLELYKPKDTRNIKSIHLEPSQRGLVVSYDSGIVVLNSHDLSTEASWMLDQKSGPGLGSMLLSTSVYEDELFVVGLWVSDPEANRLSVRVKKLELHPTIEEVGEVDLEITSNTWSVKTYDVLATKNRLLTIGGTDSWQLMACEHTRELIVLEPCSQLEFTSSVLAHVETQELLPYHPNLIHTAKGFVWEINLMRTLDDGLATDHFIASKSNKSATLQALSPGPDGYSPVDRWSLLPDEDGNLFVLTTMGSYFDGHAYYLLELHTVPDQP